MYLLVLRRMFRYLCSCLSNNVTRKLILCTCIYREVRLKQVLLIDVWTLKKKLNKISSYIRKFIREELQSHIWLTPPHIWLINICAFPHIFLLYDFATAPIWISYYVYEENFIFFFISAVQVHYSLIPKYRNGGHNNSLSSWKAAIYRHRATTYEILISVGYYG